jgi:ribonuclease HI
MKLVCSFWWGEDEMKRKVHWAAWDILTSPKDLGGVRFRDSRLMNQAILARECWRIIKNPNSLCARLLKSIYFPRGNLLDTVFRQDASPSWHGIEHGLDLIKEGIIYRIGNGNKVNIWRDNWLPRDYNLKVSQGKTRTRIRRVNQLLAPDGKSWNEALVRDVCYSSDVDWILDMKLPINQCNDFLAWHYEPSGLFSVKSAYRLAYNLQHGTRWRACHSESRDNSRKIWKVIWKANVPNKVKIFGWRVACDNLATKKNKMRRTLEMNSICNICGREEEDSFHATVMCTKSRALRTQMRTYWQLPPERAFRLTGPEWFQNLLINSTKSQRCQILMLLWRSWHLRCDIVHGKGDETIARSAVFLVNYNNFLQDPTQEESSRLGSSTVDPVQVTEDSRTFAANPSKQTTWSPPCEGETKMNVDAAFCPTSGESAAGVVIRDHQGAIILAASMVGTKCRDAEEAEATAIYEGLKIAVEYNLTPSSLESDCANAVAAVNNHSAISSVNWHIYKNIKLYTSVLPNCILSKVGRNCNEAAHRLAHLATSSGSSNIWLSPVPEAVRELCNQDSVNYFVS